MVTETGWFDRLYEASDDPWGHATRPYEQRKYALTVAALPHERYRRCFEPGCGVGVLTTLLAERCETVVAWDGAKAAVGRARARNPAMSVAVEHRRVPDDWPTGDFDLVVISELLYFLDSPRRALVVTRAADSLAPDGHLVAVHWRHRFDEATTDGDAVHAALAAALLGGRAGPPRFEPLVRHVEPDFRLDVYAAVGS